MTPVRVFVGCAASNEDLESQSVLHYTLEQHASAPVEVTWMQLSNDPKNPFYSVPGVGWGWRTAGWATPFSGFRWAIPELCNFEGRAIYFDSDFIIRDDIVRLANAELAKGRVMLAKGGNRYCSIMWDCAAAKDHLPRLDKIRADPDNHRRIQHHFLANGALVQHFEPEADWNVLDVALPKDLNAARIKAIHYTQVHKQLHYKYALPRLQREGRKHWYTAGLPRAHERADLQMLFDTLYAEATAAGYGLERYRVNPYGGYELRGRK